MILFLDGFCIFDFIDKKSMIKINFFKFIALMLKTKHHFTPIWPQTCVNCAVTLPFLSNLYNCNLKITLGDSHNLDIDENNKMRTRKRF